MAATIDPSFHNNINIISIRAEGSCNHLYTDRTLTGHPVGHSGAIVFQTAEADRGIDTTGVTFTIGTK